MDDMTEEQLITAKFAASMLGGDLADGPPSDDSPLGRFLAKPHRTEADVLAMWAESGFIVGGEPHSR